MKGFILTREVKDGTTATGAPRTMKRYDACWRSTANRSRRRSRNGRWPSGS